jgi:hypothetical protein
LAPAIPAVAAPPDDPTQTTLDLLDDLVAWTAGLDDAGPLAQKVPLLGVGVGSALGLDGLLADALADLRTAGQPLGDVDTFDDFDGLSDSTTVGEVDVDVSMTVTDDSETVKRLLLTIHAERDVADTSLELASSSGLRRPSDLTPRCAPDPALG